MFEVLTNDNARNLGAKVAFLSQPSAFPAEAPACVETKETHMSWVFLAGDTAWKLKKPVRYDFLDFSTVEGRRWNCDEEVRLNRRLAPDVYLGTVALTAPREGALALGGEGEVVDWLVKMRRLPAGSMLDRMIEEGRLEPGDAKALALTLARFYRDAPRVAIAPAQYRQRFERDLAEDRLELLRPEFALPPDLVRHALSWPALLLSREPELLEARAERVVEAHGDLRPEHVCIGAPPRIIDALEFNRELRLLDPAEELAYLSMECERLGERRIRAILFDGYRAVTGDDPPARLIDFYASMRAVLRAKLSVWHVREPRDDGARWIRKAAEYLRLAATYGETVAVTSPAAR